MSRFRVYVAPISETGNTHLDYVEVTEDIDFDTMGNIQEKIEGSEYDVGVFSFSQFTVNLRNDHGLYSDGTMSRSIFQGKRSDSLFKITWQKQDFPSVPGSVVCGQFIAGNTEFVIFEGILKDEAAQMNISEQRVNFVVLGKESTLARALVPYTALTIGMTHKAAFEAILNQPFITKFFSVETANIDPALNLPIDEIESFENKTVDEAVKQLLQSSNSVLFIKDNEIHIRSRAPFEGTAFKFYGQGSNRGIENIVDIRDIRLGINRTFNFWTWGEEGIFSGDTTSINQNGVLKKSVEYKYITQVTNQAMLLSALKEEFKNPKMEFKLVTPLVPDVATLHLLQSGKVDYPTVYFTEPGENVPIYGIARYGRARYPYGEFSLSISDIDDFKILSRTVNVKDQVLELTLRRV